MRNRRTTTLDNFWSSVNGPDVFLVINIQGIHILDDENRDRILQHIEFEDVLYVMGKGQTLKLGFVVPSAENEDGDDMASNDSYSAMSSAGYASDCRTQLFTCALPGMKARVIAEDIISYAQLRLVEMSKNDVIDLGTTHKHVHSESSDCAPDGQDAHQHSRHMHHKGDAYADLHLNASELMESMDIGNDSQEDFMQGFAFPVNDSNKNAASTTPGRSTMKKLLTSADRYKREIRA